MKCSHDFRQVQRRVPAAKTIQLLRCMSPVVAHRDLASRIHVGNAGKRANPNQRKWPEGDQGHRQSVDAEPAAVLQESNPSSYCLAVGIPAIFICPVLVPTASVTSVAPARFTVAWVTGLVDDSFWLLVFDAECVSPHTSAAAQLADLVRERRKILGTLCKVGVDLPGY